MIIENSASGMAVCVSAVSSGIYAPHLVLLPMLILTSGRQVMSRIRPTSIRRCNLKSVILPLMVLASLVFCGFGCGRNLGDSLIEGTVIDADTGAPVDSARVYSTYVDQLHSSQVRSLVGLTDENGQFLEWTGSHAFDIIEVEKESYLPAAQVVHGGGKLLFALEKVAP